MKIPAIISILFLGGCAQNPLPNYDRFSTEVPLAPPEVSPILIEINTIPPPFDLGGVNPYVLWMNGKRMKLPKKDLIDIVAKVGEENIPPIDPIDIHKGWLWPHYVNAQKAPEGRARELK